jgi:predicted RNA binding protein YcfA (HicA-like mRNA interferase family)
MSGITPIRWQRFEKFLLFIGCRLEREKGDHRIYWRGDLKRPVVIPRDESLPVFIIRNNLRILRISPAEYIDILNKL